MKVNGIYSEQTGEQKQVIKEHKSMLKYSNLKLKPQVSADVVLFKGKETVLTQEQKALNNLNALLKQNVINRELNDVLIKEVNAKNKNVIKYLNAIKASKDPSLKGHKAIAQRLVDNHAQISGAIASLKTVDDETKQKLDFDNQKTMVHGINDIYTKDKDVEQTEQTNGKIGFGGRKDRAMNIVKKHTGIAVTLAAFLAQLPFFDVIPLIINEIDMVKKIAAEYGINLKQSSEDAAHTAAEGTVVGSSVALGGNIAVQLAVQEAVGKLSEEGAKIAFGWIPLLGNIVNGSVSGVTTNGLGKRIIKIYQQQTGHYD